MLKPFCKNLNTGEVRQVLALYFNGDGTPNHVVVMMEEGDSMEIWWRYDSINDVDIALDITYAESKEGAIQQWNQRLS